MRLIYQSKKKVEITDPKYYDHKIIYDRKFQYAWPQFVVP